MAGIVMTDEDTAREVAAYVRELAQNEARLGGLPEGSPAHEQVTQTIEDIQAQLRLRGHQGATPHQRAAKRVRQPDESR